eukprot:2418228-Amphidinium_carterae.1
MSHPANGTPLPQLILNPGGSVPQNTELTQIGASFNPHERMVHVRFITATEASMCNVKYTCEGAIACANCTEDGAISTQNRK